MKLLPLLLLVLAPATVSAQDAATGMWFVDNLLGSVSACVLPGSSMLYVHYGPSDTSVDVTLSRAGVLSIDCAHIGQSDDLFLVSGKDPNTSQGYVDAVRVVSGVPGQVQNLLSCTSDVARVFYSGLLGEVFAFEPAQQNMRWKAFNPQQPTSGSWQTVSLDLSAFSSLTNIHVTAIDQPSLSHALAVVSNDDLRAARVQVTLQGSGSVSQATIEPEVGASYGIVGGADKSIGTVDGFGPPSTVLEVFSVDTDTVFGYGTAGTDGWATIQVSGLVLGDVLGVRPTGVSADTAGQRVVFETIGHSTAGSSGLQVEYFGRNPATLAEVNSPNFRMEFAGSATDSSPSSYSALAVIGLPSNITYVAGYDNYMLLGTGVTGIPVTLGRQGTDVLGNTALPIPNDQNLVGLHLCMQWLVMDGNDLIMSNIVTLSVRAENSMQMHAQTQSSSLTTRQSAARSWFDSIHGTTSVESWLGRSVR